MAHENRSQAGYGWESLFPEFRDTPSQDIRHRLLDFLREVNDVTQEQIRAWDDSIPPLQHEVGEVLSRDRAAARFAAILRTTSIQAVSSCSSAWRPVRPAEFVILRITIQTKPPA